MTLDNRLETLWREITSGLGPTRKGWIRRRANAEPSFPVYAAVSCESGTPSLMIDVPRSVITSLGELPSTTGLCVTIQALRDVPAGRRALLLELEDQEYSDVFAVFGADLTARLSVCSSPLEAVAVLLHRLARWQEFLSVARDGLGQSALVGLYGELVFLRNVLFPALGTSAALIWMGAERTPQDFLVRRVFGLDVKTTEGRSLETVTIHGETQLDDSSLPHLFLACLRLNRDISGESLCDIVSDLRALTNAVPAVSELFKQRLLSAGYLDRHAPRYDQIRYQVAESRIFRVEGDFPRITAGDLRPGVDAVSYHLALNACRGHECSLAALHDSLSQLTLDGIEKC